jgi:Tfp pilus assembly major pilin PilA
VWRVVVQLGVSSVGYLEKKEMVEAVASSGRIHIMAEETVVSSVQMQQFDDDHHHHNDSSFATRTSVTSSTATMAVDAEDTDADEARMAEAAVASLAEPPSPPAQQQQQQQAGGRPSREDVCGMSVGEVKRLMRTLGVSTEGCLEKADLVNRLVESGKIA